MQQREGWRQRGAREGLSKRRWPCPVRPQPCPVRHWAFGAVCPCFSPTSTSSRACGAVWAAVQFPSSPAGGHPHYPPLPPSARPKPSPSGWRHPNPLSFPWSRSNIQAVQICTDVPGECHRCKRIGVPYHEVELSIYMSDTMSGFQPPSCITQHIHCNMFVCEEEKSHLFCLMCLLRLSA